MDKAQAMKLMAESHRETVKELETKLKKEKREHKKTRQHFNSHRRKTSENWRAQRATQNRNRQLEHGIAFRDKKIERYREVVTQAISDLENECLWDALVKLKALEGEE